MTTVAPPPHKLKGYCPDGGRCRFTQAPCSQMCSRLQPSAIAQAMRDETARLKAEIPGPGRARRRKHDGDGDGDDA